MQLSKFNIVIIGGGMVGQAFALSMAKTSNLTIAIIEPNNPNPTLQNDFSVRVSAITPKSEAFLQAVGAWDLIKRKQMFTSAKVWDQNSQGRLDFNAQDHSATHVGHIIENDAIQQGLFSALQSSSVVFIQDKLSDVNTTNDGYQVLLENTQPIPCSLLVGADGARSRVRDLAKIEFSATDYHQKAIVCNIQADKSFEGTIWQRFLSESIIALLPLSAHQASVVWSAENGLADELLNLSPAEFAKHLSAGVEYRFGAFEVLSDINAFPLTARSAKDYVKPSLALIGDAAHNIHPLAGQGVNLGFSDVQELSQQLNTSNQPIGDYGVLRRYARARRFDNELMANTMSGLNWIYKENNEPLRWLRGFGMNVINKSPILKSFFQKQAAGH